MSGRAEASGPIVPGIRLPPGDRTLLVGAALIVVVDLASLLATGQAARTPAAAISFAAAEVGLVLGAVVAWRTGQQANARLMAGLAGVNGGVDLLGVWPDVGPAAFLSGIVYWFGATMFGHLLLRWPEAHLTSRLSRAVLGLGYAVLPLLTLAWQLLWDRRWFGAAAAGWWWPTLLPSRDLAVGIWTLAQVLFLLLVLAVVALVVRRNVRAPRVRRRQLLAVTAAAAILGAAAVTTTVLSLVGTVPDWLGVAQNLAILAVPAGVLLGSRRTMQQAASREPRTAPRRHPSWPLLGAALVVVALFLGVRLAATSAASEEVPHPQPLPAPSIDVGR